MHTNKYCSTNVNYRHCKSKSIYVHCKNMIILNDKCKFLQSENNLIWMTNAFVRDFVYNYTHVVTAWENTWACRFQTVTKMLIGLYIPSYFNIRSRVKCLLLELQSHCCWAADNNVHTTTAVASSQNINSDSCRNFYVVDDAQIIKQRKITTLKVWRRREYSRHYFVRAYFSTNGAGAAGVAKDFQLNAAKFRSSVQERQLSTRTSKQPV